MAKHGQIPWRINISSQNLDHGHRTTSHASVEETTLGSWVGRGGGGRSLCTVFHPLVAYCCPVVLFCHRKLVFGLRPSLSLCPPSDCQCKSYYQVKNTDILCPAPLLPSPFLWFPCFFYCCMSQKHHTLGCIPRFWPIPSLVLDQHIIHLGTGPFLTQLALLKSGFSCCIFG